MLLGSVAEDVFRHAHCPVLTVGPTSYPFDFGKAALKLLFATDFGEASLAALPHAISFANHLAAKLILLHVVPAGPVRGRACSDLSMRDSARTAGMRQLEQLLLREEELVIAPEFVVCFGTPAEKILQVSLELKVDLIFMGLRRSAYISGVSHIPWATAYDVASYAACPVLTVRAE
jgi:nucleotide-binding universal stress UspA family protein